MYFIYRMMQNNESQDIVNKKVPNISQGNIKTDLRCAGIINDNLDI